MNAVVLGALVPVLSLFAPLGWNPLQRLSRPVEEGNGQLKAGKAEEALAAYDKAVAELPSDPGVHFNRGAALFTLSRFDEAATEFLRATEAKDAPLKESAFYNLGNALFKKDKFAEAAEAYKRALTLDPKDARAKWNLEIALKKKREDEQKKQDQRDKQDKQDNKDKQDSQNQKNDDKQQQQENQKSKEDQAQKPNQPDKGDDKQADNHQDKAQQQQPPPPKQDKTEAQKELEAVLDSLEKSPKDLERERARIRAVRRAPAVRDW